MDELAREYLVKRDPKVRDEIYRLGRELAELKRK